VLLVVGRDSVLVELLLETSVDDGEELVDRLVEDPVVVVSA
jgi:hypothetical protein